MKNLLTNEQILVTLRQLNNLDVVVNMIEGPSGSLNFSIEYDEIDAKSRGADYDDIENEIVKFLESQGAKCLTKSSSSILSTIRNMLKKCYRILTQPIFLI